ncbi:Monoacylglycerol lipase ABHD6 [Bienertia sinuspersici]
MLTAVIFSCLVAVGIYKLVKPPPSRRCGSPNGPPVTSTRIRLSDGRYLAYKVRGAAKEDAKYKVIINHGFAASKDTYIPVSDEWLQELGIFLVTFDRPGYAESDPNPYRSPRSDAFDIQELADQLELGPKIFVVGISMGSYPAWGCLKYIPHRLAGVAFVVPVINYWWPLLPSADCSKAYSQLSWIDQWRIRFIHYAPVLAWSLQQWLPFPTMDLVLKSSPKAFAECDLAILKHLSEVRPPDISDEGERKLVQQSVYESFYRDFVVTFGSWEFNPLELTNPFPENSNTTSVHLWTGGKDGFVAKELSRHISQQLPWVCNHEVPYAGHLFLHDKKICEMVLKSLILGDNPSFE